MEKYTFEFLIHDQMLNSEYEAQKQFAIKINIEKYLEDIQEYDRFENHSIEGSILNKKIAYDIARGNEDVANAKFGELSTEAIYRANLENIQAIKLQIKILQNQYDKEWGMAGGMYE